MATQPLDNLLARWTYTDREAEMFDELFRRVDPKRVADVVDYLLATHKDIERPTLKLVSMFIERGTPSRVDKRPPSTMAPPPPGRPLSNEENKLFFAWLGAMMSGAPEDRAAATKLYMDASTAAGHVWTESYRNIIFAHWQRNVALAAKDNSLV